MKTATRIRLVGALMLFVGFAFFGCGSSGDGDTGGVDGPDRPGDELPTCSGSLCASGLSVLTAEPRVGYRLAVNTGIGTAEDIKCPPAFAAACGTGGAGGEPAYCGTGGAGGELPECVGVTVSYYALNRSDVDLELDQVRQFFLATVTFEEVTTDKTQYLAEFKVPLEAVDGDGVEAEIESGEYYIQYIIDPDRRVTGDLDRSDNSCGDDNATCSLTPVTLKSIGNPNLFIQELTLDSPMLFLYADEDGRTGKDRDGNPIPDDDVQRDQVEQDGQMVLDVHDADAGGTLVVGLEGSREPLDVTVFAYLRMTHGEPGSDSLIHQVPLYLWDSVAQKYVNAYGAPPKFQGAPEGLLIGTLSPQIVTQAEEGLLELPDGCESTDCAPELEQLPDDRVEMVTEEENPDLLESLRTSDRTSVHLDLYYPGGLVQQMWNIVEEIRLVSVGTLSTNGGSSDDPNAPPPDLTPVEKAKLATFFRDVTWESIENGRPGLATPDPDEPATSFSIVAKVVCGTSDFGQVIDDNLDDNEASEAVNLMLEGVFSPPGDDEPLGPMNNFGEGTEAGFGGENFKVSFDFRSGAYLDARGAGAFVAGEVPVKIFKSPEFNFVSLDARAQVLSEEAPDSAGESGFFFDLEAIRPLSIIPIPFVNENPVPAYNVLFTRQVPAPSYTYPGKEDDPQADPPCPDYDTDLDKVINPPLEDEDGDEIPWEDEDGNELIYPPDCPQTEDACPDEPGFCANKGCPYPAPPDPKALPNPPPTGCPATQEFSVSKAAIYNQVFFVGPVPFTISAGVGGTIGFALYANIQPFVMTAHAGPFARLEATATGAIGIPILRAGFGGTLTLIDEQFRVEVTTGLAFFFEEGRTGFEGSLSMSVINTLEGPKGELFLFVDYPVVKWCTGLLGNQFPCGLPTVRLKKTVAKFGSFVKQDVLFDQRLCKRRTFPRLSDELEGSWDCCRDPEGNCL